MFLTVKKDTFHDCFRAINLVANNAADLPAAGCKKPWHSLVFYMADAARTPTSSAGAINLWDHHYFMTTENTVL